MLRKSAEIRVKISNKRSRYSCYTRAFQLIQVCSVADIRVRENVKVQQRAFFKITDV